MKAVCLRCGIDVAEYGVICKDCWGVDKRYSQVLKDQAEVHIQAKRNHEKLFQGLVYVGNTQKQNQKKRDKGRKR